MTNHVPDVSVIIPVYNTVDYLRACLDSLVNQTIGHDRLEVVAVDDGSTDGSGELLYEYATSYPAFFKVVHQENSGGPAGPCNVALDHATGRFLFFLGSDDYLALDGLERLVERADAWEADVVVPPMEGINGRFVDQRLFGEEHPELPFPGELLAFALSNTKLFRRSLVVESGISYPLDLRVGSDQPFAVAAMVQARRVGVLGRPTVYFAVKRDDQSNITYRADWRTRIDNLTAVVEHLCELVPEGDGRDVLLVRHFTWEFDKVLTRDLAACTDEEAAELLEALQKVAAPLFTEGLRRRLSPVRRLRWFHALNGRADLVREAVTQKAATTPILVEAGGISLELAGFRDGVDDWVFAIPGVNVAKWVIGIDRESTVVLDGDRIVLTASTQLVDPASAACMNLVLSPTQDSGVPRAALDVPKTKGTRVMASAPLTITPDGQVRAELDLTPFIASGGGRMGLRLRIVTEDRIIDRPVRVEADATSEVRTRDWQGAIRLTSSEQDRILVDVAVEKRVVGRIRGRFARG